MTSKEDKKKTIQFYGKFAGLGMQMFFVLLLAALGGQWLDNQLGTPRPYITIVMILLGLTGILYKVIKDLQ